MAQRVFVVWDLELRDELQTDLELLKKRPGGDYDVQVLGIDTPPGQIWNDQVRAGIAAADFVLAFVDLANANVGFEIGYALGLGKPVRLARRRPALPKWLDHPPLTNQLAAPATRFSELQALLQQAAGIPVPKAPPWGTATRLVCPPGGQGEGLCLGLADYAPPLFAASDPWTLADIAERLAGAGRFAWVLVKQPESADGRDSDNAALGVVAASFACFRCSRKSSCVDAMKTFMPHPPRSYRNSVDPSTLSVCFGNPRRSSSANSASSSTSRLCTYKNRRNGPSSRSARSRSA